MKRKYFNPIYQSSILGLLVICLGCSDNFFDKQPLRDASEETFWKSEGDAMIALAGVYRGGSYEFSEWTNNDFWNPWTMLNMEMMAGNGSEKELGPDNVTSGSLTATNGFTGEHWRRAYMRITTCNNFLGHLDDIPMDEAKKAMLAAEARTIRAFTYFNLAFYYSDVPLVTEVLSIEEANAVTRTPKATVMDFAESELKESATALPATRPNAEHGRITQGAALAILGRLQMAKNTQQGWTDAASTYESIIDAGNYVIEPMYEELFTEKNELNKEFILTSQYLPTDYEHTAFQFLYPEAWGGWHQFSPYNELVKDFPMEDGLPIDESPLYDPNNPYENRDPRLYYNILISDVSEFKGQVYKAHPDSIKSPDRISKFPQWSGYAIRKFMDEDFTALMNSGFNWPLIRYAEVLLGHLESKLESGAPIDQGLLDETINKVRARPTVEMPPVTTTNPEELREIIRTERRIEFAFEGLRYYDILRWGIAAQELNRKYTGMKLTDDVAAWRAKDQADGTIHYPVDDEGYYILPNDRKFKAGINELWPVPQSERDINKSLSQNPGY